MTKIFALYYSMYGHIEIMAKAVAEGVRSANADVVIKRVPDTMPTAVALITELCWPIVSLNQLIRPSRVGRMRGNGNPAQAFALPRSTCGQSRPSRQETPGQALRCQSPLR